MTRLPSLFAVPLLLAPLCAVPVGAAQAQPDAPPAIQRAFGNTILSTYPDGRTARLWLDPSGSYTAMGRRKDRSSGHWKISGDKLCLKQSHPFAPPFFKYCTAIPESDHWSAKAVTGEPIRVRLVPGRASS